MIYATIGIWRYLTLTNGIAKFGTPIHPVGRVIWHDWTKFESWYVALPHYWSPFIPLITISINAYFQFHLDGVAWHCPCGWHSCCLPKNILIHIIQYLISESTPSTQWLWLWPFTLHVHGWQLPYSASDEIGMLTKIIRYLFLWLPSIWFYISMTFLTFFTVPVWVSTFVLGSFPFTLPW